MVWSPGDILDAKEERIDWGFSPFDNQIQAVFE
jgi:hypothetical protein